MMIEFTDEEIELIMEALDNSHWGPAGSIEVINIMEKLDDNYKNWDDNVTKLGDIE